jgi:hypothetical protein
MRNNWKLMQRSEILLSDLSDPDPKLFVTVPTVFIYRFRACSNARLEVQHKCSRSGSGGNEINNKPHRSGTLLFNQNSKNLLKTIIFYNL